MRTLLLMALLPLSARAADSCPLVLQKEAVEVRAPAGWAGYSPSIMRLTGYGMMAGPPQSMTYLVPGGSKKAKGRSSSTWGFAGGDEKWLYCTYDGGGAIQISKRMPDAATECELSHKKDEFGSIADMRADCR